MYETLKQLIEESIDLHLWEDNLALKSIHHPHSRYAVWKAYYNAKEAGQITTEEYQDLHTYYDKMLSEICTNSKELLIEQLKKCPSFEVYSNQMLYTCTKSLKSKGMQISLFIRRNEEWVAWGDRQCLSLDELTEAVYDYGIVYEVNKYLDSH